MLSDCGSRRWGPACTCSAALRRLASMAPNLPACRSDDGLLQQPSKSHGTCSLCVEGSPSMPGLEFQASAVGGACDRIPDTKLIGLQLRLTDASVTAGIRGSVAEKSAASKRWDRVVACPGSSSPYARISASTIEQLHPMSILSPLTARHSCTASEARSS